MLKFEGQTPSALTGAVRTPNVYLLRDGDRGDLVETVLAMLDLHKSHDSRSADCANQAWPKRSPSLFGLPLRCDRGVLSSLSGRMHRVYYWSKHSDFGSVIHISIPSGSRAWAPIIT